MGRAYSQPEIFDNGAAFQIQRVRDPDDEFATVEVLCEWDDTFEWVEEDAAQHFLPFRIRPEAERFLRGYQLGYETAREDIARSLA